MYSGDKEIPCNSNICKPRFNTITQMASFIFNHLATINLTAMFDEGGATTKSLRKVGLADNKLIRIPDVQNVVT